VRFLLDEQLHPDAAASLDVLARSKGDEFTHILQHTTPGMDDADIPALCHEIGVDALITANVRDFGAKRFYYAQLVENGVHVVVLRPRRIKFTPEQQVSMMSGHLNRIRALLAEAAAPVLVKVTLSSAEPRSLEELLANDTASKLP
jgi:hypothetical protein